MDAKAAGATDEEAFEAALAALKEFGAAATPGTPTASDIARELAEETRKAKAKEAEERRKAKAKEEAERIAAEREHYGVGQATPAASTPKPPEKAPTPAKPSAAKMTPASAPTPADVDDALLLRLDDDDAGNADALEARHGGSFGI
jgi:cell division protein FtsN